MKKFGILVGLVLFALVTFGDGVGNKVLRTKTIKVVDKETKESLTGVEIKINGETTYTDFDGEFEVSSFAEDVEVTWKFISYRDGDSIINIDKTQTLELKVQ